MGMLWARPVQMFFTGLMLLAGSLLLDPCANLGSLFAARAAIEAVKWRCTWRQERNAGALCARSLRKPS